jgi:uncharacterized protein
MIAGQIIAGEHGRILMRVKSGRDIELGELLISESQGKKMLLQVYDLQYGSQISRINLELMSGMKLEEDNDLELMEPELRAYSLAVLKNLLVIDFPHAKVAKSLPVFFSQVRKLSAEDMQFLSRPQNPLCLGKLRSGSQVIDIDVVLDGDKVLAEHILIPATTGRGKSNLTSCILWDCIDKEYCGILVLDPHDEYYGRNSLGLKDHPSGCSYYTPSDPPPGTRTLKINLGQVKPGHFNGAISWSDPQLEALHAYHRQYKERWIESLLLSQPLTEFHESTVNVVRRRLRSLLGIKVVNGKLACEGVFDNHAGESTIKDICDELERGRVVVIDTSMFSGAVEILVGSVLASELFNRYRRYKISGQLHEKPVVSIVLEEAPRVLGKDVLMQGRNIFSTIAREGRKFKVGLIAITQLPSLIPREILANMNTKIILGIEMAPERQAVIDSASQDLSNDGRNIASLDKGEAIVTSNFARFAIPLKIPFFPELVKETQNRMNRERYIKKDYQGISL